MTCLDISAGEMVCPNPEVAPWLTGPLPYTGQELTAIVAVALAVLALGLLVLYVGRSLRR